MLAMAGMMMGVAAGGGGAYARVGGNANALDTVTSLAVNPGVTVQVNDDVLVGIFASAGTAAGDTVVDNLGNTYTAVFQASLGAFWRAKVTVAGSLSAVTYTPTATNNVVIHVDVLRGGGASNTVEGTTVGTYSSNPGTATDGIASPSHSAPGVNGCFVWGFCASYSSATATLTTGTGFTVATSKLANLYSSLSEYLVQGTSGAIAATFTDATNGGSRSFYRLCAILSPAP